MKATSSRVSAEASLQRATWLAIALLWFAGNGLRLTILAVPPVIAMIRTDFALSATQVGLLSSIPSALFAVAALGGSLLVTRLGIRGALSGGLLLVAAGSALRGLSTNYTVLFVTTMVMAAGVAILQPMMPTAVRRWLPQRIGLGTAVYTNGLLVGEILPTMLTIPAVLPLLRDSWREALVFWSVPIVLIAVAVYLFAPRARGGQARALGSTARWLPDWHAGLVWRLGLLFCCFSGIYFSANAFIPIYLASAGRPELISGALTALNLGQLPASFLLLAVASKLERRAWPYVACGALSLLAIGGLVWHVGAATIYWAALLGFAVAGPLIMGLTLPPLLCRPDDVARMSAGVFTISYGGAVGIAIVSGVVWDLSGVPALAFVPLGVCAVGMAAIALRLRREGELF